MPQKQRQQQIVKSVIDEPDEPNRRLLAKHFHQGSEEQRALLREIETLPSEYLQNCLFFCVLQAIEVYALETEIQKTEGPVLTGGGIALQRALMCVCDPIMFELCLKNSRIRVDRWLQHEAEHVNKLLQLTPGKLRILSPFMTPVVSSIKERLRKRKLHKNHDTLPADYTSKVRTRFIDFLLTKPRHRVHPIKLEKFYNRLGLKRSDAKRLRVLTEQQVADLIGISLRSLRNLQTDNATMVEKAAFAKATGYIDRELRSSSFLPRKSTSIGLFAALYGVGEDTVEPEVLAPFLELGTRKLQEHAKATEKNKMGTDDD